MTMAKWLAATAAVLLLMPTASRADSCQDVLQKTDISSFQTWEQKLAYLQLIDKQEKWEAARKVSGGLDVIVPPVMVGLTGDYETFQKARSSLLSKTQFNVSESEARSITYSGVSGEAIWAWHDCMNLRSGGFAFQARDITRAGFSLILEWVQPPVNAAVDILAPRCTSNGVPLTVSFNPPLPRKKVTQSVSFYAHVLRPETGEIRCGMAIGGYPPQTFVLPHVEAPRLGCRWPVKGMTNLPAQTPVRSIYSCDQLPPNHKIKVRFEGLVTLSAGKPTPPEHLDARFFLQACSGGIPCNVASSAAPRSILKANAPDVLSMELDWNSDAQGSLTVQFGSDQCGALGTTSFCFVDPDKSFVLFEPQ